MSKVKILAIVGSLRQDSYNKQLAIYAQKFLHEQADLEILNYNNVPLFNQDHEYPTPEAVQMVREKVKEADGIWFFTPEYNHFFSGVLKNLLDWLSRPEEETKSRVLSGKPAAISGVTPGMSGTGIAQDHLVILLSLLNMDIMNVPRLTIPNVGNQLDVDDQLVLNESESYLKRQAEAFVKYIKKGE